MIETFYLNPDNPATLNDWCGTYYLNEDKTTRPCSLDEYIIQMAKLRKANKRHVGFEEIDNYLISTVWLGLDHSIDTEEAILFETMVFPDKGKDMQEIYLDRYATWQEAEEGHKKAVQWVKDGCND